MSVTPKAASPVRPGQTEAGHGSDPGHGHGGGAPACAHAHDHARRAPRALAAAEISCRDRGLRLTPIRRDVLAALYETHRPLSAYELAERTAGKGEKSLSAVSVYRALDFLIENGFAHRLESRNAFVACPSMHGPGDLVVFMICEACGGVDEAVSDELSRALAGVARDHGFAPDVRLIELAGRCSHCR
jgi:Fur family zinc uptake transcriptional regulator